MQAVVVSDGAAVYEKPDFDSKVIDFVPYNTKVVISRKAYAGTEGLGLFHKVRVRGKIGFIPDTDIRVGDKDREKEEKRAKEKHESAKVKVAQDGKTKSMAWDKEEDDAPGRAPIYLSRYLGMAASRVHFTEKFQGHKLSDQLMMYGVRMTGPGTLFDGPPLDVNLWFSLDEPKYYDVFSSNVHGFLLFGDVMAMMPLVNLDNWVVNYGLGVMWTYTRYRVQIGPANENTDALDFRIGLDAGLGVGFRVTKTFVVRLDAKYYYEKTAYAGYTLSLQREY